MRGMGLSCASLSISRVVVMTLSNVSRLVSSEDLNRRIVKSSLDSTVTRLATGNSELATLSGGSAAAGLHIRADESDDIVHGSAGTEDRRNPGFLQPRNVLLGN